MSPKKMEDITICSSCPGLKRCSRFFIMLSYEHLNDHDLGAIHDIPDN